MQRRNASDFSRDMLHVFEPRARDAISRRAFLDATHKLVGGINAAALVKALSPDTARAVQVSENDRRIKSDYAYIASPQGHGAVNAYLAYRNTSGTRPGVLILHEEHGLNAYIEDVARRLALAGFIALAPDGLSAVGGYPGDDEKGSELFNKIDAGKVQEDFRAAGIWLKTSPSCSGKLGILGFGFGAGVASRLAAEMGTELVAAVSFYGSQPSRGDASRIKAPFLAHYAELDTRITSAWPTFDAALSAAHVPHEGYVYRGANHGFHNDTTSRYDEAAARLAWQRTLDWLNKYLSA